MNNNKENYYKPDEYNGICVVKRKGEDSEDFIKRFRKKYAKSGLAKELREKMYFEKPSDRRRRKKSQSIRLLKKEEEKLAKFREESEKYRRKNKKQKMKYMKKRSEQTNDSSAR